MANSNLVILQCFNENQYQIPDRDNPIRSNSFTADIDIHTYILLDFNLINCTRNSLNVLNTDLLTGSWFAPSEKDRKVPQVEFHDMLVRSNAPILS